MKAKGTDSLWSRFKYEFLCSNPHNKVFQSLAEGTLPAAYKGEFKGNPFDSSNPLFAASKLGFRTCHPPFKRPGNPLL